MSLTYGLDEIPRGEYAFIEFFCDEPGCDCRRVFIFVVRRGSIWPVATISHSFDPPRADALIKEQTFLEPLHPNEPYAPRMLRLFVESVLDEKYDQRLRRHYAMVRESLKPSAESDAGSAGIRPPPPRHGKKWKRR